MRALRSCSLFAVLAALLLAALPASASHSWSNYHWARTSNPFILQAGDNVGSTWDGYLTEAISDWSVSGVLDVVQVTGGTSPKTCRPTGGRIEVCNARYGQTGWLGVAQVWVSGAHITQATAKMNDTYFTTATYNTPAWRRLVMCQEIAHDFGLDHQDEAFENPNLGTCMDYTNDPDGGPDGASATDPGNEHPNQHDDDQLATIYSHTDSTTTVGQQSASSRGVADEASNDPGAWGEAIRADGKGRSDLFVKDLGRGRQLFTFVFWAE